MDKFTTDYLTEYGASSSSSSSHQNGHSADSSSSTYGRTTDIPSSLGGAVVPEVEAVSAVEMCDFHLVTLPNESRIYTALESFSTSFDTPSTYLSIIICILGTGCNLCNITVLTRRSMRTAVNTILCAIASCDTVVMLSNLIFILHYNVIANVDCGPSHWTREWGFFAYLHSQITMIGHSSSVWLSVMMGHLRYSTLRSHGGQVRPRKPSVEMAQAYVSIIFVLLMVTMFNVPNCLSYKIEPVPVSQLCGPNYNTHNKNWVLQSNDTLNEGGNEEGEPIGYMPQLTHLALQNGCLLFRLAFWISGIIFKVIPCVLLTTFIIVLLRILSEVRKRRVRLLEGNKKLHQREESADRTTRMLITVICVFLATELPQGFMSIATGIFSREFKDNIYQNLGDVLDLLSLINSCSTFVIYCSMSKQYRTQFGQIFVPKILRFLPASVVSSHHLRQHRRGGGGGPGGGKFGKKRIPNRGDGEGGSEGITDDGEASSMLTTDNPSVMPLRKRVRASIRRSSLYRRATSFRSSPKHSRNNSRERRGGDHQDEHNNNNNHNNYPVKMSVSSQRGGLLAAPPPRRRHSIQSTSSVDGDTTSSTSHYSISNKTNRSQTTLSNHTTIVLIDNPNGGANNNVNNDIDDTNNKCSSSTITTTQIAHNQVNDLKKKPKRKLFDTVSVPRRRQDSTTTTTSLTTPSTSGERRKANNISQC